MRTHCDISNAHSVREKGREGLGTEGRGRTASERRKPWPQELGAGRVDRAPFGDRTCTDPGGRTEAEIVADRSRGSMAIDSARKNGLLGRTNAEIGYIDAQAAKEALRPKITANAELDGSRARHCDGEDCPGLRGQVLPKYLGIAALGPGPAWFSVVVEIWQTSTFETTSTFEIDWYSSEKARQCQ